MMKLARSIAFSLSIAAVPMFAVACGGTVEHSPQTTASAATKAPVATGARGPLRQMGEALGEVALRPEQRAEIEKLAADAEARRAPPAEGRKELMLAFADQIEKGTLDRAALQPMLDKVKAEGDNARAADRAALVRLHEILDVDQRNAFVDALERNMKSKRGPHAEGGPRAERGPRAEWMKHAKRGPRAEGGPRVEGGPRGERMQHGLGPLKQLSEELRLTDEQKAQLRDALRDAHEDGQQAWKPRGENGGPRPTWKGRGGPMGMLEAFRADKLDLEKLTPPGAGEAMAAFGADRMIAFAEKLLPVLTPEQRKIAADKLRGVAESGKPAPLGR